jgi:hypothetical protein
MDTLKIALAWIGDWAKANPNPATVIVVALIAAVTGGMIYGASHDGYASLISLYQAVFK